MNTLASPRRLTRLALLATVLSLLVAALPATAEESLETVLSNYYEAVGGTEAWSKVRNMKQTGTMSMMGTEAPFVVWSADPNKLRVEFELQGMKGIQALNGDSGWMVMPFMTGSDEPEPMPSEMVEDMAATSGVAGPLFDYQAKGNTVELIGKEDVEGTETYHLEVTLESGKTIDFYLDAEYYVPIQQKMTINMQGQEFESVSTLSDYQEVEGLMLPFSTSQSSPMGEQVMTTKSVEINVDLEDDFFAMPKVDEDDDDQDDSTGEGNAEE